MLNIRGADDSLELTVIRVARDATWVDVRVRQPHTGAAWSKRLPRFLLRSLEAASRPRASSEAVQEAPGQPSLGLAIDLEAGSRPEGAKMKRPTMLECLSLSWPWAVPVVTGYKPMEVRSWQPHRSLPRLVAIHQAKSILSAPRHVQARSNGRPWPGENGIVGIATLVEVIRFTADSWEEFFCLHWNEGPFPGGLFGWRFREPVKLAEPVPCKGGRGLWRLPPEVIAAVYDSIEKGVSPT